MTFAKVLAPAEVILQSLGVTEPNDIDLEAICWLLGVKIKYRPLDSCEARIVGEGNSAIVTVNSKSHRLRQRFSIGHELGHWEKHRGQIMACRSDDIDRLDGKAKAAERRADIFAADLLMPTYLFGPAINDFKELNFETIGNIAETFDVSWPAAAIRAVEKGDHAAILICHNAQCRRWFVRSSSIPSRWFPRDQLQPDSTAMAVLFGKGNPSREARPHRVPATAWFDSNEAARYEVLEQSRKVGDEVLSLVLLKDHKMLLDR